MDEQNFYFDTSIWLDHYEKRGAHGESALQLILKIIHEDLVIFYSDIVVKELQKLSYSDYEINALFSIVKPDHLRRVHTTKEQGIEARRLSLQRAVPFGDVLHAVLARDYNLRFVSRDKDFQKLKDVTITKIPEELI